MPSKFHWDVLGDFVQREGWTKGVELGVRWGATSLHLMRNCPDLHLWGVDMMRPQPEVDLSRAGKENYVNWDWKEYRVQVDKIRAGYPDRYTLMEMTTDEASELLGDIDFVFIDADHSYEGVLNDIKHWAPKTKHMVFGHDMDRGDFFSGIRRAVDETFTAFETRGEDWNWIWWAKPDDFISA